MRFSARPVSGISGTLFPTTDEWRDASSLSILADAAVRSRDAGWTCRTLTAP